MVMKVLSCEAMSRKPREKLVRDGIEQTMYAGAYMLMITLLPAAFGRCSFLWRLDLFWLHGLPGLLVRDTG